MASARLTVDDGAVARALALARGFCQRSSIGRDGAERLAIVVEEWLCNVVEHAGAAPGSRIGLRLERRGDLVFLTASDAGAPFDPRKVTFEGPNVARGGGAGLALILAWARIAAYRRRAGRNRVVIEMPLG